MAFVRALRNDLYRNRIANGADLNPVTVDGAGNIIIAVSDGHFDGTALAGSELVVLDKTVLPRNLVVGDGTVISGSEIPDLCDGIICVNNVITRTEEDRASVGSANPKTRLSSSTDGGATWSSLVDPVTGFSYDRALAAGPVGWLTFVQGTANYALSYDNTYVYFTSDGTAGVYLGRCLITDDLRDPTNHEWRTAAGWDADPLNAVAIINVSGFGSGVLNWNPVTNRFILTLGNGGDNGRVQFYDSSTPWGSFTLIFDGLIIPGDATFSVLYVFFVNAPGYLSADGLTWTAVWSGFNGDDSSDSFNTQEFQFQETPEYSSDLPTDENPWSDSGKITTPPSGGSIALQVASGTLRPSATATPAIGFVNSTGMPTVHPQHRSHARIIRGTSAECVVLVCCQSDGRCYYWSAETNTTAQLYMIDNITDPQLGSSISFTWGAGEHDLDLYRTLDGVRAYIDGVLVLDVPHNGLSDGAPGWWLRAASVLANAQAVYVEAGNLPDPGPSTQPIAGMSRAVHRAAFH